MGGQRGADATARLRPRRARARALVPVLATSLLTTLLVGLSVPAAAPASAATGDFGTPGSSLVGFASAAPTATKPESKLWFAQGSWWASMASATSGGYSIHRLDRGTSSWVDSGVALDPRPATQADVLWNGTHLLVASHAVAASSTTTSALEPSRLFRYSWDGSAWTPDAGFPVDITGTSSESLTIAQTGTGRLWATWTLNRRLYLAQTTGSADADVVTFGTAFIPLMDNLAPADSLAATTLEADDISTIVSADGATTLLWSNQLTGTTWSARRTDAGSTWSAVPVMSGPLMSDDHLNLRAIPGDPAGRVVAVVKTSLNDAVLPVPTDPLLRAAVFTPASGTWSLATIATVAESATRPVAVVEPATDELHVFYTGPSTPGIVAFQGTVYEKTSSLSSLDFPADGTPVLRDVANATMNNATSTRQPATAASGVVVLAATATAPQYWFADSGPRLPAAPTASFTPTVTTGLVPLTVSFADTSTGGPTSWAWDFGDGGTSTDQSATHTFTDVGSRTVTLTATSAGGSTSASMTIVVLPLPPVASFTTSTSTGTAPMTVAFTDTTTGAATSWAWDFGDGAASTEQSPTHEFASTGTFTVTLTAANAGGSTTSSTTVTSYLPAVAAFEWGSAVETGPLALAFTDTSTGAPTSWLWDFGDGAISTDQSPVHAYAHAGPVVVRLTVENAQGSTSTSEASLIVGGPPSAGFTLARPSKDLLAVDLTDTTNGSPESLLWDFGDGTTQQAAPGTTVRHVYARTGSYAIRLTATNGAGTNTVDHAGTAAPGSRVLVTATASRIAKPTRTVGPRSARVQWRVPSMNGEPISTYQVLCRAGTTSAVAYVRVVDGASKVGVLRTGTVKGLVPGRRYTCQVKAFGPLGWNLPSLPTSAFTARA